MLARAGQDVLGSARGRGAPGTDAAISSACIELPPRRRAAVKKAFKHLDPSGAGFALWDDMRQALMAAPFLPAAQQKVLEELQRFTERGQDGKLVASYANFLAYYYSVSQTLTNDGEFEQLLHSQWGYSDVSDILTSMQRQFTLYGIACAFQDASNNGEMSSTSFEAALKRAGLTPRQDDLQRLLRAFVSQGGGGVRIDDFKAQLLSPRPETPPMTMRDLSPTGQGVQPAQPRPIQPTTAKPGAVVPMMPRSPPTGRPGSRPVSGRPRVAAGMQAQAPYPQQQTSQSAAQALPALPALPPVAAALPPMAAALPAIGGGGGNGPGGAGAGDVGDDDLDAMLNKMESHLHKLKKKREGDVQQGAPPFPISPVTSPQPSPRQNALAASGQKPVEDDDLDAMLSKMEGHLHHLRKKQGDASGSQAAGAQVAQQQTALPDGPINDVDLDAALNHMEDHLNKLKSHQKVDNATPHWDDSEQAPPPVDMPHWEHHKYGHHKITDPAWKPEAQVTDLYGHQHSSAEYGYSTYGAGSHGHHVSHYHLNDYHGLAHHDFKQQEYQKSQFGDKAHHGHSVPHLHGIGTSSHHGEHSYKKSEYSNESYGKEEHSHWVPHLHHIGESHAGRS